MVFPLSGSVPVKIGPEKTVTLMLSPFWVIPALPEGMSSQMPETVQLPARSHGPSESELPDPPPHPDNNPKQIAIVKSDAEKNILLFEFIPTPAKNVINSICFSEKHFFFRQSLDLLGGHSQKLSKNVIVVFTQKGSGRTDLFIF